MKRSKYKRDNRCGGMSRSGDCRAVNSFSGPKDLPRSRSDYNPWSRSDGNFSYQCPDGDSLNLLTSSRSGKYYATT